MLKALRLALFVAMAALSWKAAMADDFVGVQTPAPTFVNGSLSGCAVNFVGVHTDNAYAGGRNVGLSGSLNLYIRPDGIVLVGLKLGYSDNPGAQSPQFQRPARILLIDGFRTNASEIAFSMPSDDSDFLLVGYDMTSPVTSAAILSSLETGRFRFAYARPGGGTDTQFTVDMAIGQNLQVNPSGPDAWRACVDEVLSAAIAQGQHTPAQ